MARNFHPHWQDSSLPALCSPLFTSFYSCGLSPFSHLLANETHPDVDLTAVTNLTNQHLPPGTEECGFSQQLPPGR